MQNRLDLSAHGDCTLKYLMKIETRDAQFIHVYIPRSLNSLHPGDVHPVISFRGSSHDRARALLLIANRVRLRELKSVVNSLCGAHMRARANGLSVEMKAPRADKLLFILPPAREIRYIYIHIIRAKR